MSLFNELSFSRGVCHVDRITEIRLCRLSKTDVELTDRKPHICIRTTDRGATASDCHDTLVSCTVSRAYKRYIANSSLQQSYVYTS